MNFNRSTVMKRSLLLLFAALLSLTGQAHAADTVVVVSSQGRHPLERMAVEEVTRQLQQLFGVKVSSQREFRSETRPAKFSVEIGTQDQAANRGRRLGSEGHALRTMKTADRTTLRLTGGSPLATYWAAIEFGEHFGVRRLLHADFQPLNKPDFNLDGVRLKFSPQFKTRAWRTMGISPASQLSWSLEEHKLRLRQLVKLKFNHLIIPLQTWQPFVRLKSANGKQRASKLWNHPVLRVDGETAGRAAFGREPTFTNPELRDAKSDSQRTDAGIKLVRAIISEAKLLGMNVTIECEAPDSVLIQVKHTYPGADEVVSTVELPTIQIGNIDRNVLPHFDLKHAHAAITELRRARMSGFVVECQLPDDFNTSAYYLARTGFDAQMTPKRAVDELVTPICGEVSKRIAIGFDHLAKAANLIYEHNPAIATPGDDVIMRHYNNEPVPEWWGEAKTGFIMAMNEMYRANTRARGGARAYSLYLAKKFEFALHYFTVLESVRAAGIGKSEKDKDAQLEGLDKAVEAMHNALSAIADVDRNNGDRGIIALLNEYGFRPLIKELESADN
ncbi:MAG: hypothetical protein CMO80_22580 [Verrucomicrobiales bacterium]|nr:hypothetical protein [Verrucomicrobiales bacterium]|tara:strand:+ start:9257 stop:10936 length:1680 start_codon:yes stop_codon:yes gene_type:complete